MLFIIETFIIWSSNCTREFVEDNEGEKRSLLVTVYVAILILAFKMTFRTTIRMTLRRTFISLDFRGGILQLVFKRVLKGEL